MTKYGYHRVSTLKQELEGGIHKLKELGIEEENLFYEKVSGKSKKDRLQLNLLLEKVAEGDEVIVLKIDRLARSIVDLNNIVQELKEKGVTVSFIAENLTFQNDSNPMNQLLLNVMGSFAEFERSIIVNRMNEGKQFKLESDPDFKLGRKKKYSKKQLNHAVGLLENNSYTEVERLTGISKSTLIRVKRVQKENGK